MQQNEQKLGYSPNEYFTKKMTSGKYLVTTRHRRFVFLDECEYTLLQHGTFKDNKELFEKFEDAGIIITKKNILDIIHSFEKQHSFIFAPKTFRVNLSNECNLLCKYCLSNAGPQEKETMTKETMDKTIEFMLSAPGSVFYLEFQGGEPLAKIDQIKYFVEKIKGFAESQNKKIVKIVIVTNMTLMNEKIAEYILENNIGFCSSLDGPQELHDANRIFGTGGGSYKTVAKWLTYFRGRGKTINLLPTITSSSLSFGAKSIIDEYLRWGCKRVPFRPLQPLGRGKQNEALHITPEEFISFWKDGIEYMIELSSKGTVVYDPAVQAMIRNIMDFPVSYMCMRKPCGAAISHISISPDGTIYPCDLAKTIPALVMGSVHESYYDVALGAVNMTTRTSESQPLCDTCVFGAYCGSCYTRTYATYSDAVPRTPRDYECKVNAAMFQYLFEKMQEKKYMDVFELWIKER